MPSYNVTVKFNMTDGRELVCEYAVSYTPGRTWGPPEYCYPDECEPGEPSYFIDGEEIEESKLPKGLDKIAAAMYECDASDKRFSYSQSEADYDGDYFDYD